MSVICTRVVIVARRRLSKISAEMCVPREFVLRRPVSIEY